MFVGICEATFRAEWVSSLKEKRMVVKSLVEKTNAKRDEQNKKDALHQNYLRIFLQSASSMIRYSLQFSLYSRRSFHCG